MPETPPAFAPKHWAELPAFFAYRALLARCEDATCFPAVESYRELFSTRVSFVVQSGKLAVGLDGSDVDGSYVGHLVRGIVPTRRDNLHDFFNALTWALFPTAKAALFERLYRYTSVRILKAGALRVRDAFQDRAAMIDEGGLLVCPHGPVVFGHALLEDAARGRQSRGFPLQGSSGDVDSQACAAVALALSASQLTQ